MANPYSLNFAGAGTARKSSPTGIPNSNAAFSFSVMLKPTYTTGQNIVSIVNASFAGQQLTANGSTLRITKSAGGLLVAALSPPTVSTWHRWTYTFDGTTHSIYIDGVLNNTSTTAPDAITPNAILLATYNGTNGAYTGLGDELIVWNRCITPTEVAALDTTYPPAQSGLVLWWHCNEGTGTNVADASGNGNNATLSGGPTWSTDTPTIPSSGNSAAFMSLF